MPKKSFPVFATCVSLAFGAVGLSLCLIRPHLSRSQDIAIINPAVAVEPTPDASVGRDVTFTDDEIKTLREIGMPDPQPSLIGPQAVYAAQLKALIILRKTYDNQLKIMTEMQEKQK